jgi:hypothetical protein
MDVTRGDKPRDRTFRTLDIWCAESMVRDSTMVIWRSGSLAVPLK